jgi:hypothetical protein
MNELELFANIEDKDALERFIADYNPGHDETQMRYFIVGAGVTDYGKYKQAIAELYSHRSSLQNYYIEQKRTKATIDVLIAEKDELGQCVTPLNIAKMKVKDVDIEEKELALLSLDKNIARSMNEFNMMFAVAKEYEQKIHGCSLVELEKEYHIERLSKLLAMNTIFNGNNLSGVMETVTNLPEDMQNVLIKQLHSMQLTSRKNERLLHITAETLDE